MTASANPLPRDAVDAFTAASTIWRRDGDALLAELRFPTFREAFAFLVQVAMLAEAADHHPAICNTFNRVSLRLVTHDAGNRVTDRDIALARAIEAVQTRPPRPTPPAAPFPAARPRTLPPAPGG